LNSSGSSGNDSKRRAMKKQQKVLLISVIMLAVTIFAGPSGCVQTIDKTREPFPEILWPEPPETPRIRFVGAVSEPEDLQIRAGWFSKFLGYLLGKSETSMVAPYGVEIDDSGRLYVVDTFLRTVHVFDGKGKKYYTFPAEKANLVSPIDIAVDHAGGRIYVSDSKQGVLKIFEDGGKKFVGEAGKGFLGRPTGIAINEKTSELLVVDTASAHIFRYDLQEHQLKAKFGGIGTADGKLNHPTNIWVTGDGIILVSDSLNFRIQAFTPEGRFVGKFGSVGDGPGYFSRPRGVAADSDGNIYVVDGLFDNIQIFDKEFRLLMALGRPGQGYGEFWLPTGIYIDKNDVIYVADSHNKRVQIFQYLKEEAVLE
jgi:DNA-binding beta-propeller fold protein YncE